jgi:hypothetical protein
LRELIAEFRRGAAADRTMLLGQFLVWATLIALLAAKGVNGLRLGAYGNNLALYASTLSFFVIFTGGAALLRARPDRPIQFLRDLLVRTRAAHHFMRGAPMLFALALFMPAFSAMKSAIPLFQSFSWDPVWIAVDRSIHGADPWRILQPLLGYPAVTALLAAAYHLWILLIYAGGIYFCFFQKNAELRTRYFIGFFAIWTIIGVAMATGFASVGPCFVGPLLDDPHFNEQMAYLRAANEHFPIMVLDIQDQLVAWHLTGNYGLGRGITAMPSMHVSLSFLFFLAMRRVSQILGLLFGVFFVIILIGSVHLAYHYAVDGYVSIAVTWLIWAASGVAARRIVGTHKASVPAVPVPAAPPEPAFHGGDR